jgi:molybdate transport system substrate-binding protein
MRRLLAGVVLSACTLAPAGAAEIRVLSGGAIEPGLEAFAHQVKRELGHDLKIQFNTTPQIVKRLAAGEVYDIVMAPPAVIDQGIKDGIVSAEGRVPAGRVGAGIFVRSGVQPPKITSMESLKQAVLAADSVVYNTASSGIYLDQLFGKMGVLDEIKPKSTRYADGASVMEHVIKGKGNEIGFGAITEIKLYVPKGAVLVGPLPAEVQNYTTYHAAVMSGASSAEAAKAVLRYLATPAGKAPFTAAGVE